MTRLTLLERRLRISTGLILAVYIVQHLVNHSLGLVSLEAMESMRKTVTIFWRSWPGSALLYGSLLVHLALALLSLYRRTTLRMPPWELAQLALGLALVPLLAGHIATTWGARVLLNFDINYEYALTRILSYNWELIKQALLVSIAWAHAMVGLHFFFRLQRWYRSWSLHLYFVALLIPLLLMLSILRVGFELGIWQQEDHPPVYLDPYQGDYVIREDRGHALIETAPIQPELRNLRNAILAAFWSLLALTLIARALRKHLRKNAGGVAVRHINGQILKGEPGQTLLEIIRSNGVAHASLCGGRGRCTTCRVRVGDGLRNLADPSPLEQFALTRIRAAPNVRLACQTRPLAPIHITPLMPPDLSINSDWREGGVSGEEREIVALFVDLRESSRLSERHLPYDVLFILNRFFLEMTDSLEQHHGHYAQFEGDGLLALFGLERGLEDGCRNALRCAVDMQARIDLLNAKLVDELRPPLRIGIGIHCGLAIVGTMGPPGAPNYSAIGDCVNAAARLEVKAKQFDCVIVASEEVVANAGLDASRFRRETIRLRGNQASVGTFLIDDPARIEF